MKRQQFYLLGVSVVLLCGTIEKAECDNAIIVGRYQAVPNKPPKVQQNLLSQVKQIVFSKNITTVGEAIKAWLLFSGYRLSPKSISCDAYGLYKQPLPEVDRSLGPMSLRMGLETLVGNYFYLLIDPVHRYVSFQLKPMFYSVYEQKTKNKIHTIPENTKKGMY